MNILRIYCENGPSFNDLYLSIVDNHIDSIIDGGYDLDKVNAVASHEIRKEEVA